MEGKKNQPSASCLSDTYGEQIRKSQHDPNLKKKTKMNKIIGGRGKWTVLPCTTSDTKKIHKTR